MQAFLCVLLVPLRVPQLQFDTLVLCGAMGHAHSREFAPTGLLALAAMRNLPKSLEVHEAAITCIKNLAMDLRSGACQSTTVDLLPVSVYEPLLP
jgi:hypothetical protein